VPYSDQIRIQLVSTTGGSGSRSGDTAPGEKPPVALDALPQIPLPPPSLETDKIPVDPNQPQKPFPPIPEQDQQRTLDEEPQTTR
jgi:hypothetical protein